MVKKAKLVSVEGYELPDGAEDVTPTDSIVPVYLIPDTPEQIAEKEQWAKDEAARIKAEEKAATAKAKAHETAVAKLEKLGLTVEEISAIIGA